MRNKVSSKAFIIECAEEIISKDGLEACTSRVLCKKANVALGTIYNYFDSRDDLLEHVFILSWNKTKELLLQIQTSDIDVKDKMYKLLVTIGSDVTNRRGLGSYLIDKTNLNIEQLHKRYSFFDEITQIFITVLQESDMNKNTSTEDLEISALWIIFGHMSFMKRNINIDMYYKQVINKFL
jgi:AcrR family transcriptional regulator